ncbi:MAG: hypothetical protein A4E52_00162 [Pelotomaculum sp. PtaB.Bin013]|uniref:TnsD family transposase n=1 Tax=Pelotomaculum isophthalicicum JI TaxID=947010 RepID=A0A9X4GZ95_9FIRM|nr:TnsD family transposase [Pelotomaculum isophthalicicum]MDF9408525.1 TnsD family transposase [Pelotomaculum isophthalicicum JI]OPX92058.1 MAG: hypothetical protein A4E52_00162 [Pelotomaculum sp. PtaB.Bin013]
MLPFFPTPYPDEILYSVFARYHMWSRNMSLKDTMMDLFGCKTACAVMDLPNRLEALYKRLPHGSLITPELVINRHSLFPLFRPFLPKERANKIIQAMKGSNGGQIHTMIGIMASSITSPRFLRYCHECMQADEEQYGEPYWHRIHQVFGVQICPDHKIWLTESDVAVSAQQNKHVFQPLIKNYKQEQLKSFNPENDFSHYLAVAEAVHWLLNNEAPILGLAELRNRYINHLQKIDLATYTGRVRQRDLIESFKSFYGPEFLVQMNSAVDYDHQDNWLSKLVREPRITTYPIRHILFMRFLGVMPEKFLTGRKERYLPFGRGPWPCLNAAANHYRQPVIEQCSLTRDYDTGLPVGTFSCSCGFTYLRCGPDQKESDRYKIGRIKSFGPTWEKELIRLAVVEKKGLRESARQLNVDPKTIKNQLKKIQDQSNDQLINDLSMRDFQSELNKYRARWLEIAEHNPGKTKTELRRSTKAEYAWLYRHDRDWLNDHSPTPIRRMKYTDRRVNWVKRDEELAERVSMAAQEIKQVPGRPVRLTISSIGKRVGELALLQKHLEKLPKTKSILQEVVETAENFQVRRVEYAVEKLREQGELLRTWKIVREAGLRPGYSEKIEQQIQKEIENL